MNYSRMWHTCYWRLSFLIVPRWRLSHCWVNTSMPLRNNPRWLEMLLSLRAECDITSFLVFVPPWMISGCCFFKWFWKHVVFLPMFAFRMNSYQVVVDVNEEHVRFVSSCDLYYMPNSQTCFICLLWSFCRFFANLHFGNRGDMVLMCVCSEVKLMYVHIL